jgi:DNA polymerase-3 subunit epsilon
MKLLNASAVVIDVETTGLSTEDGDRIVELGLLKLDQSLQVEREFTSLVNPERQMGATRIHGIRDADVKSAPTFADIAGDVGEFCAGSVLVGHNAGFDVGFLISEFDHVGLSPAERNRD